MLYEAILIGSYIQSRQNDFSCIMLIYFLRVNMTSNNKS